MKTEKKYLGLVIKKEIHDALQERAKIEGRSLSGMVSFILSKGVHTSPSFFAYGCAHPTAKPRRKKAVAA